MAPAMNAPMRGEGHAFQSRECAHGALDTLGDRAPRRALRAADSRVKGNGVPDGKPNILVIWGDDIGITNLSCYSDGLMGYRTPNIDRIAHR
jgi:hypothetical protein